MKSNNSNPLSTFTTIHRLVSTLLGAICLSLFTTSTPRMIGASEVLPGMQAGREANAPNQQKNNKDELVDDKTANTPKDDFADDKTANTPKDDFADNKTASTPEDQFADNKTANTPEDQFANDEKVDEYVRTATGYENEAEDLFADNEIIEKGAPEKQRCERKVLQMLAGGMREELNKDDTCYSILVLDRKNKVKQNKKPKRPATKISTQTTEGMPHPKLDGT